MTERRVARICEEPGRWIVSDNALDYIDARGRGYVSRREAIAWLRHDNNPGCYTHYISKGGKVVKIAR
jgi:hypothetical protein